MSGQAEVINKMLSFCNQGKLKSGMVYEYREPGATIKALDEANL
ncbi:unnamed protein product [Cuscuta epithymum]|uniref:Uncharacterized protein n=1 Tax=Cuscuta epithymum TaxID=186058 RepID=A0AAV0BWP4_9ASTE|nr:unnamed protein product [Cuscuta epithymum]